MHLKRTIQAGLSALALAGLAACQSDTPEKRVLSNGETYQSPADVNYIYDNEGNVARQMPVEMLKEAKTELLAHGHAALAKNLEALYDFSTGEVKDARAAELAEGFLKSQLPQIQAATPSEPAKTLRPEDLPAGIAIPPELIENLRKSAAKGGAR